MAVVAIKLPPPLGPRGKEGAATDQEEKNIGERISMRGEMTLVRGHRQQKASNPTEREPAKYFLRRSK